MGCSQCEKGKVTEESRSVEPQKDSQKQRADPIKEGNGAAQTEPPEASGRVGPPTFEEQHAFWNWHWDHWHERRTLNAWKDRRNAEIVRLLRGCGLSNANLLDLGCGPGHYTRPLTEFGRAVGIDLSVRAIATARAKYPEIEFHAGNLYEYSLPLSSFDAVVAQEVFDHVPDQDAFLGRVHALLKPGGWLALSCTNAFAVDRLAPGTFPTQPSAHIARPLTMRELRRMLATRFSVLALYSTIPDVAQRGIYRVINAPKVNRIACLVLPLRWITAAKERMGLGYQLIALARKRPYATRV
jgi:2-polyprenyl-3-methyl-5-hydroxy-6-metoxy-1,4-benzoquinol methylase